MKTRTPFASTSKKQDPAQADRAAIRNQNKKAEAAHDAALVERFKAGDESAFNEVIQRYYPRIRALANQTLHNQGDAEEVAQDTFIRAHRGLANFRGECSLATWLYCIGLNLARNRYWFHFRRRRQDTISIDRPVAEGSNLTLAGALSDGSVGPRSESMTSEFVALVSSCMERLDASHREILTMRTMLNLSYEEIAESLTVNVGTVKSRIARARERLRELLRQMAPEFGQEATATDYFEFSRPLPTPSAAAAVA